MKTIINTVFLALMTLIATTVGAQERPEQYLGLPGDNLNLYAVMKLFQESETLEAFEKNLNDENSRINNLDLNGNNLVDYIMVVDYQDGNVHNIVLRVALDRNESQDVAVFIVEQYSDGSASIQLIGDEDLYGKNYIVEPYYALNEGVTPNPGYVGVTGRQTTAPRTTIVQINAWPVIRYIYNPGYVVWRSAWHWDYRPIWWSPWTPYYYHYYYGYHYSWQPYYNTHFRVINQYRYTRYNDFYVTSVRTYSSKVTYNIRQGNYKSTYSRPELRREGEALYSRTNAERLSRAGNNTQVNNESRRQASTSTRIAPAESNSSGSDRRTSGAATARQTQSTDRNTQAAPASRSNDDRRTTGTVTARPAPNTQSTETSADSRRTTPVANTRQAQGSSERSVSTDKNSASPVTARPASQPDAIRNNNSTQRQTTTVRPVQESSNIQRSTPQSTARPAAAPRVNQSAPSERTATVPRNTSSSRPAPAAVQKASPDRKQAPQVTTKSASASRPSVSTQNSGSSSRSSTPAVSRSSNNSSNAAGTSQGSSSDNSRNSNGNSGSSRR